MECDITQVVWGQIWGSAVNPDPSMCCLEALKLRFRYTQDPTTQAHFGLVAESQAFISKQLLLSLTLGGIREPSVCRNEKSAPSGYLVMFCDFSAGSAIKKSTKGQGVFLDIGSSFPLKLSLGSLPFADT